VEKVGAGRGVTMGRFTDIGYLSQQPTITYYNGVQTVKLEEAAMTETKPREDLEGCAICGGTAVRRFKPTTGSRWTECQKCQLGRAPLDIPGNNGRDKHTDTGLDAVWDQTHKILKLAPVDMRKDLLPKLCVGHWEEILRVAVACAHCGNTPTLDVKWPRCAVCGNHTSSNVVLTARTAHVNYDDWNKAQVTEMYGKKQEKPEPCICGATSVPVVTHYVFCTACSFGGAHDDIKPEADKACTRQEATTAWNKRIQELRVLVAALPACSCGERPLLRPQGLPYRHYRRYCVECGVCEVKTEARGTIAAVLTAWQDLHKVEAPVEGLSFLDENNLEHCALCGEVAKMGSWWPWCPTCHDETADRDLFKAGGTYSQDNCAAWNTEQQTLRKKQQEGWRLFKPGIPLLVAPCAKCGTRHKTGQNSHWPTCRECGQSTETNAAYLAERARQGGTFGFAANIEDWNTEQKRLREAAGETQPVDCSCGGKAVAVQTFGGGSYYYMCERCRYGASAHDSSPKPVPTKQEAVQAWAVQAWNKITKNRTKENPAAVGDIRKASTYFRTYAGDDVDSGICINGKMIKGPRLTFQTNKEDTIMQDIKNAVNATNATTINNIKDGAKQAAAVKAEKVVMEQFKRLLGDSFPESFYATPIGEAVLDMTACYLATLATNLFPQMPAAALVKEFTAHAMTGVTAKAADPILEMAKELISGLATHPALLGDANKK